MVDDFSRSVRGVGSLAEPVRRRLYEFVAEQAEPVSRDSAAAGIGVARHTATFHLDRLVADGLLETSFKRLSGRTGPGAGRPAKLYTRASGELAVSLPPRHYDVAGRLMAQAIDSSSREGVPVLDGLRVAAAEHGRAVGDRARAGEEEEARPLEAVAQAALAEHGYEPRVSDDELVLLNCPFHALATEHTDLVCGMNLALLRGVAEGLGADPDAVRLEPHAGRCCVVMALR